jgi:hypothetical protein
VIASAWDISEGRQAFQDRLAAGPYCKNPRKAHWDYVLIEMRWMVGPGRHCPPRHPTHHAPVHTRRIPPVLPGQTRSPCPSQVEQS